MRIEKKLITSLLLFFLTIFYQIASGAFLLTDDLGRVKVYDKIPYLSFINEYLNTDTMTSRPVSGFFYASIIYLIKYSLYFYYLNYIFFLFGICVVYFVLTKICNEVIAAFSTLIYSLSLVSSSMVFSPIMMNASLAIIFYCLSVYVLIRKNNFWLSIFFYLLSVLSYEIMLPAILISALVYRSGWRKKIIYVISGLALIFIYREVLEPLLFTNFFHRDRKTMFLNTGRDVFVIKEALRMIFIDIPHSIIRSVIAVKFYSISDFIIMACSTIAFSFYIFKTRVNNNFNYASLFRISICGTIICLGVFFVSEYFPNLYGFKNRNLGGIRLFSSIFIISLIFVLLKNKIKALKIVTCFITFMLVICTISIKNAWIYGSEFNDKLFLSIKKHISSIDSNIPILVIYDAESKNKKDDHDFVYRDEHFILREPIYMEEWETSYLKNKIEIEDNIFIKYYYSGKEKNPKVYYLYELKTDKIKIVMK